PAPCTARLRRIGPICEQNGSVLKKVVALLLIGFVIYYLLTTPTSAADAVSDAFDGIMNAFEQLETFFNELTS
ncbi:MAG: hypothetical protein ABW075_10430, partial [Aeromicrobium sp.]